MLDDEDTGEDDEDDYFDMDNDYDDIEDYFEKKSWCNIHFYCLGVVKSCTVYGAQNETYMSRSAEKWVRGLCFNELGVCG